MKYILAIGIVLLRIQGFAQLAAEQRIQDSVIGWWTNNKYDHLQPQKDVLGKKKEATLNKLVDWMKKSYTPVGGLGTYSRYIANNGYGVNFLVWNVSHEKRWTDAQGKFKPIPEENTPFNITINQLYGAFPIYFMNNSNGFYFVVQPDGYNQADREKKSQGKYNPTIYSGPDKYITWVNDWSTVYLAPNNKLPWIPVSRGELLQKAEEGLATVLADKRKEVESQWPGNKKAQDEAYNYFLPEVEKYRSNIHKLRDMYRNDLDKQAVVRDMQPTFRSFITDPDIFKIDPLAAKDKHAYPVYKLDAAALSKTSSDQPLWVAISFPFETPRDGNQLYELYTAMSQNINYDYLYNYFFDPAKVQGKAYSAANAQQLAARLDGFRKLNLSNIKADQAPVNLPAGVHFSDDFSSSTVGGAPRNWYFRTTGAHATVVNVDNQQGNWLQLGYGNKVVPSLLKKPLPENFSLEFDVVSDPFTVNTGGSLRVYMSTYSSNESGVEAFKGNGNAVSIELIPGLASSLAAGYNYRGEIRVKVNSNPEVNVENFSNGLVYNKPLNEYNSEKLKTHFAIQLKDGRLTVSANGNKIADSKDFKLTYGGDCKNCDVLKGARINTIQFTNITSGWGGSNPNPNVAIGNVVVKKV